MMKQTYVDDEAKLRVITENQQNGMRDQREKCNRDGNPDYDTMTNLENCMQRKVDNIGESLKQ